MLLDPVVPLLFAFWPNEQLLVPEETATPDW
jgi:hypothetical protein